MSTILSADGSVAVHTCAARGCTLSIPGEQLMCQRHWKLVPGWARHEAIKAYRAGMDMRNAIDLVEARERPTVSSQLDDLARVGRGI